MSAQARTRIEGIRARLLAWDPLGIDDVVDAEDEYDCMIGPLARLLVEGASTRAIKEWLVDEVRDHFELPSDERRERALAVELQTWWAASTG